MKNAAILIILLISFSTSVMAQFTSVQDGNWTDPLTWSTDPNATAIPDSNSTVNISHNVIARSTASEKSVCFNLTIDSLGTLDNFSSAVVDGSLLIKNDLINNGTINPAYDFYLEIGGNFYNNGVITKHYISQYQRLYTMGNIYNNGSFHFTHTSFSNTMLTPNTSEHIHFVKSLNDSSIFLGETQFLDSLGTIIVDSLAILSGSLNLNNSKIVLPEEITHPNNLVLDNFTLYGGEVEANSNKISTKDDAWAYLGNFYGETPNLVFINAKLDGNFVSGGTAANYNGTSMVIFKGTTSLTGKLADWYSGGLNSGDRGIFIDGIFTNNGDIYNATANFGLHINQRNNSIFNSNGSLQNKGFHFSGTCYFSTTDSLAATEFKSDDSNTIVNVTQGNIFFKNTVTVDFNGGSLNLANKSKFFTTYQWYNLLQNIDINANYSQIKFASINDATEMENAKLAGIYFLKNSLLSGKTEIPADGYVFPYSDTYPHVVIDGDVSNYGTIANHVSSGSLYLEITGNIMNDGVTWSNAETKLTGDSDQNIIIPNDVPITGKVVFDAMLDGTNYQWKKDSIDISGATSRILEFPNGINPSDYGCYYCDVDGNNSRKIFIGKEVPKAFEIMDVVINSIDSTSTVIHWKTTVPASGYLFYVENDPSNGYPYEVEDTPLKTEHSVTITDLNYNSTYYFIIDQYDENWMNTVRSQEYSFIAGNTAVSVMPVSKFPDEYMLSQNYPNPFNPSTKISFTLPKHEHVEINLYNAAGQKIRAVYSGLEIAGKHEVSINAADLSSGVYFYSITAGKFHQVRKMIVMK